MDSLHCKKKHQTDTSEISKFDRTQIIALFAAFSIFLSSIEYLLPRPIPFFRYGLANIAILLVIRHFRFRDLFLLSLLKVLGLGILNGTFASYVFVFSLLGSTGACLVMWSASKFAGRYMSLTGISMLGAMVSNILQISCAVLFIFGPQSWVIAPYLLLLGIGSGILIGLFAQYYWNNSHLIYQLLSTYTSTLSKHHTLVNQNQGKRD